MNVWLIVVAALVLGCERGEERPRAESPRVEEADAEPGSAAPVELEELIEDGPAPVVEARRVEVVLDQAPPPVVESARLKILSEIKGSPIREVADPAPRTRLERRMILAANRDFERTVDVATLAPSKRDERWRHYITESVPGYLHDLASMWFTPENLEMVGRYEEVYGGFESVEEFIVAGKPGYLAVFERRNRAERPISIFKDNYTYTIVFFRPAGSGLQAKWALDLRDLFPGVLEMDDLQMSFDGSVYVNANYLSYAKEVDGKTAYLYGIDVDSAKTMWRSKPLRSRNEFAIVGNLIVSGYGFTAEKDYLYVIEARSGNELHEQPIKSGHDWVRWVNEELIVRTYGYDYRLKLESP